MAVHPEHRSILAVDIESFGSTHRTNPARVNLRRRVWDLCAGILHEAGIQPPYSTQDIGDGYLFFIDPRAHKSRLLDALIAHLDQRLDADNSSKPPAEQVRLRVALHAGEVLSDPEYMHGDPTIHTCRLLDSRVLRTCLKETRSSCALIVSLTIYDNIVKHAYGTIEPATFHPVLVKEKETHKQAWIHVPGDSGAPVRSGVSPPGPLWGPIMLIPRELPPAPAPFIGRDDELARLRARLGGPATAGPPVQIVIDGAGGIGKSALAIRAARDVADRYPDGQLYADLAAATSRQPPLDPLGGLRGLLVSLGLGPEDLPTTLPRATALYRSLLAGRRMLVVLDNAVDSAQVAPLLPGHPACAVLVTNRSGLDELDGVTRFGLDVLRRRDATDLLTHYIGPARAAREPEAVEQVASYCDDLPLALRIAGARLAARPAWTVAAMARRLAAEHSRLDELSRGNLAVRTSLGVSYQAIRERPVGGAVDAARAFRLLGLLEGRDVGTPAAAALLGQPTGTTEAVLEHLCDEHLLDSLGDGRYRFQDLVRIYARELADAEDPPDQRLAASTRAFQFYLATAQRIDRLLRPRRDEPSADNPRQPQGLVFHDRRDALDWLEAEYPNLIAAVHQAARLPAVPSAIPGRLAHHLFTFFTLRNHLMDWEQVSRSVLTAARRDGDLRSQGQAYNALGCIAQRREDFHQAAAYLIQGLQLRRQAGDLRGEAGTLVNLGVTRRHQGRRAEAVAHYQRSIAIYRQIGDQTAEGQATNSLGNIRREARQLEQALMLHRRALSLCDQANDRPGQSYALYSLGQTYHELGRYGEAVAAYEQDLEIARELGDEHGCAETLRELGRALQASGRPERAGRCWGQALIILERLDAYEPQTTFAHERQELHDLLGGLEHPLRRQGR